ncbi:transcription regulator protein BACH1b [Betta splendens]|uniref:Transcription regulator protein BACH1b n=1 Tax=Betta splendens TaxID=158456 RepID=A0A6P7PNE7_BETSP|nr:transcription regulator protein BACH1b [Betta splendens]XP_029029850.1 transcription regulator protein BACH1b [Betta splendens]XP_055358028.1 transcription regulator protein BACH1b [Betta splendens]
MAAMAASRSSVFTFESTVHSAHVLRRLDEQRRRETLCDVTVVVEGRSFRAHRSVLASCSEYFSHRVSALAQHGVVVTLPQEVTAAGFEPLLAFAYTSKLHFGKDNVLEIRNSASVLGFRDLDEACFDFLLPKFLNSNASASFPRKTCCKRKCKQQLSRDGRGIDSDDAPPGDKAAKPVADSPSQQEEAQACEAPGDGRSGAGALTPAPEKKKSDFTQCPKYRKFQRACGRESCVLEKRLHNTATVIRGVCELLCSPCPGSRARSQDIEMGFPAKLGPGATRPSKKAERHEEEPEGVVNGDREGGWGEKEAGRGVSRTGGEAELAGFGSEGSGAVGARSPHRCPSVLAAAAQDATRAGGAAEPGSVRQPAHEQKEMVMEDGVQAGSVSVLVNQAREEAPDAGPTAPDAGRSRTSYQDPDPGSSSDAAALGAGGAACPFYQGGAGGGRCAWKAAALSECEGASQSSLNSADDGDSETETEGDSECYARERAREVQLPFPVDWVVDLSRNDFQHLLKQQVFTPEQLEFVHDMRRRCKNRLAAQRCRKRKLDCIYNLQCEIHKLRTEREKLLVERSQLGQMKLKTCHTLSALCQRVCSEASLQPEQLEVLARFSSTDCPLASLLPHADPPPAQPGFREASSSGGDAVAGGGQY